jgi:hypothetical protein
MLLIVIFNAVLAAVIVSVIVALHSRAILTERVHHDRLFAQERRRRARTPNYRPDQRPVTARPTRQPAPSAG